MAYTAQQLQNMGYYGYAGWNDAAANADFNATQGAGKGKLTGGIVNPEAQADNSINQTAENLKKAYGKFTENVSTYKTNNPFSFDEYLKGTATQQAQEQQGLTTPGTYYNQTLSDYLLGVNKKIERGGQDTMDFLGELSANTKSYSEATQLKLTEAINKAGQGFADVGLFESGGRYRNEGLLTSAGQSDIADYQRQQGYRASEANKLNTRTGEDYGLGGYSLGGNVNAIPGLLSRGSIRDVSNRATTDVQNLASSLTGEELTRRNRELYNLAPPDIQANQGFDILKQIGYS